MRNSRKQPLRVKHVPQRTCIACRETRAKRELIRLVRTPGGDVEVDSLGRREGRGAYLCPEEKCWEVGLKKDRLERALGVKLALRRRQELAEYGKSLGQKEQ